ncbi:MAG: hypothetical protein SCALA702_22200 [Melioribacteraceae bacterium]|nr:MAG: hypothetical protein SCALA702_22200 [Melioribacteraceae bacterium]
MVLTDMDNRKFDLIKYITIMLLLLISGCNGEDDDPVSPPEDQGGIEKSSKRGLAYNLTNAADFDSLKSSVSWWYNWGLSTDAPDNYYSDYSMEYIPMLWGGNPAADYVEVKNLILANDEIEYLLVLNEPNLTDQANQTPEFAAENWVKYEKVISDLEEEGRTVYLVGPGMNWGTMSGYSDPVVWLDAFYEAYRNSNEGKDPKIDYLAFHWYDYGLEAQLDRLAKYGKQIWITEMANWNPIINSYAKQMEQMTEMVAICENRDDVFRYAWFIGRGTYPDNKYTYLFEEEPGKLTELGKLYISLPYKKIDINSFN